MLVRESVELGLKDQRAREMCFRFYSGTMDGEPLTRARLGEGANTNRNLIEKYKDPNRYSHYVLIIFS